MKKLSPRVWLTLVLVGLVGQFAWTIENMYFNVYLYNTISTDPGYISAMVGWSAAAATLTTLLMGALSDRVGKRKLFICGGYLLWGLSTAAFGLVTVENAAKLFPAAAATAAAAVMIVVLDCVMTFFGSTANDAAFNAWITDTVPNEARGKAESVLAILPLISMLVIFGLFDGMTQRGEWQKFFGIFGGLVVLTGLVSVFLIPEPKLEPRKEPYLPTLVYGLRPAVVKENPALYLSFAAFCLFSVAVQVFFPYLIIYMQNYLHFDGYALVLGIVLIFASVVSVLSGRMIDRLGELTCVLPAAGVMFAIVQPWASNQFGKPDEPTQIVMVQEETHTQETETGQTEQKADDEKETAKGRKKNSKETDAIEEYRMHYDQMKNVVDSAENSLVKIKSYVAKMDWFSESYENVTETSGLVFRVDSNWLYILTSSRFIKSAQQITVTFPGGEVADAAVRQQDTVTELAILEIPLKSIKESTIQSISAISIKGISSVEKGEPVIAVGSPMGYTDSINYGMITSITECEDVDGEYKVIATDMAASDMSYGFLLNLDGNMVGIVAQKFKQTGAADTLTALGISDISYLLEMLAAGRSLPYTGVVGKSVSADVAEHFSVPYGIYVKKVNTDSPAMYAGIQAADVITEINGESVGSMSEYEDILRKYQEGDTLKIKVRRKSIGGYADIEMKLVMGAR